MSQKIVFKHLAGRKRGINEVYPLSTSVGQLRIGRDPACEVRFDPVADTCVSRHHAAIQWDESEPRCYTLVDLLSSNGTILNGRRVDGSAQLKDGDIVEFGQGGPTVRVEFADTRTGEPNAVLVPTGAVSKVPVRGLRDDAEHTMKQRAMNWHRK